MPQSSGAGVEMGAVIDGVLQDLSGEDGCVSAEEMVALMNNPELLMQVKGDRTVMMTGANRDADGTIDRSPPPTAEVKVILKEIKRSVDRYGIDMTSEFRTQGATQYGTVTKSRFNSIITTTFGIEKDHFWDDAKLNIICIHYGTGSADLHLKGKMQVAWMDLCEDLAEIDASYVQDFSYKAKGTDGPDAVLMLLDAADGVIDGNIGINTGGN